MSTKGHCSIFGRNCEMIIYGTRNVVIKKGKIVIDQMGHKGHNQEDGMPK